MYTTNYKPEKYETDFVKSFTLYFYQRGTV